MRTRLKAKSEAAKERQKKSNLLSLKERIDKLDKKLGVGIGAKKEREKLAAKIAYHLSREITQVPEKLPDGCSIMTDYTLTRIDKPKVKAKERRISNKEVQHKSKL